MLYIDSKRITQKIISKKIMYELQYNNILWKWGKILEAKTEKRTNFKGKCSKEAKEKKKKLKFNIGKIYWSIWHR